ncbi:hypothetical protein LY44_00620, partial [Rhodobacter capsulatus]
MSGARRLLRGSGGGGSFGSGSGSDSGFGGEFRSLGSGERGGNRVNRSSFNSRGFNRGSFSGR